MKPVVYWMDVSNVQAITLMKIENKGSQIWHDTKKKKKKKKKKIVFIMVCQARNFFFLQFAELETTFTPPPP